MHPFAHCFFFFFFILKQWWSGHSRFSFTPYRNSNETCALEPVHPSTGLLCVSYAIVNGWLINASLSSLSLIGAMLTRWAEFGYALPIYLYFTLRISGRFTLSAKRMRCDDNRQSTTLTVSFFFIYYFRFRKQNSRGTATVQTVCVYVRFRSHCEWVPSDFILCTKVFDRLIPAIKIGHDFIL